MTLDQWLAMKNMTEAAFAERIGCSQASVNRYRSGRVPEPKTMRAIFRETDGVVTANDFFGFGQESAAA